MDEQGPIDLVLVVGGRWHDMDYARLQLLLGLDRHDRVRTRVFEDYASCRPALAGATALISYTCDLRPDARTQAALAGFVRDGGRWLGLHASNSVLDPPGTDGTFRAPDLLGPVSEVLGSRFLAHPPIAPYRVDVVGDDPLVAGLSAFTTTDELYLSALYPPLRVLLQTRYSGPCRGFELAQTADDEPRPVLYRKASGAGEVCYFTLGHCRGRYDVQDLGKPDLSRRDRAGWASPEFRLVLARTLAWAAYGDGWPEAVTDLDIVS
jgi:type 1 glutamine amidotransferase